MFGFNLKGMIVEKTIKEESSQNNHYNDNYNYNCDTITTFSTFSIFNVHVFNNSRKACTHFSHSLEVVVLKSMESFLCLLLLPLLESDAFNVKYK